MAFKLAELFVDVNVKGQSNINSSLNSIQAKTQKLSKSFAELGTKITGAGKKLALLGGVALSPLVAGVKVFADTGDELQKMSLRTGIAIDELSRLAFVASQSGTDLATFEVAIKTMQRGLVDASRGLTTATDNFDDLGVSLSDLQGLNPNEQFTLLADKISQIEDPSLRAGLALKVFGRSGSQLLPALSEGIGGIQRLKDKADELGLVISPEQAKAAAELTDALDVLSRSFKQIFIEIGSALSGSVKPLALEIAKNVKLVFTWIKENQKLIKIFAVLAFGAVALGTSLIGLGIAFSTLSAIMTGIPIIISLINAALLFLSANPIVLVIAAVVALVLVILAWIGVFDGLSDSQKKTQDEMRKTTSKINEQKKAVDELRNKASKPIEINTEIKGGFLSGKKGNDNSDLPLFLRDSGLDVSSPIGLSVKFKEIPESEKAKLQSEISLTPVFSGLEDLFRNAQSSFAEKSLEEINKDIVKTNKENTDEMKKNTIAINAFGKRINEFGGSVGGQFMKPLG